MAVLSGCVSTFHPAPKSVTVRRRCLAVIGGHHARVPTARPQMSQQRSKTLDRQTARRRACLLLEPRRLRGLGWRHRVAMAPVLGQFLVLEQERLPRLAQVPLHGVGQQAQQDVRPHPVGRAVVNRPHQQIDPLQTPERLLHQGQSLVRPHPVGRRQPLGRLAGPDHIDPIQKLFVFDRVFLAGPPQMAVANRQNKMFGHLVMVDDLARPHADRGRRLRGPAGRATCAASVSSSACVAASRSWHFWRRCSASCGL